jgi:hypothetical protein
MPEGFRDPLELAGVWLPGQSFVPPDTTGGFRSLLALCGVVLPDLGGATGEPEPEATAVLKPLWRPRRGR